MQVDAGKQRQGAMWLTTRQDGRSNIYLERKHS